MAFGIEQRFDAAGLDVSGAYSYRCKAGKPNRRHTCTGVFYADYVMPLIGVNTQAHIGRLRIEPRVWFRAEFSQRPGFSAGAGLMVIGSLKNFGELEGGLSAAVAGSALGLLALFNGLGRIVWGTISHKLGARKSVSLMALLQAIMLFALFKMGSTVTTLTVAACWIGFNFGGNFALFPLAAAESFGTRNLGANYGAMFTAYGVGGILMPVLAGRVWDLLGSYFWAFIVAAIICLIAMVLAFIVRPPHHAAAASCVRA